MLQESPWAGLLFLAGIAVCSWWMLAGAVLGALAGMLAARWPRLATEEELGRGFFGYNGALVGIAAHFYFPPAVWTAVLVVAGSVLSSWLMRGLSRVQIFPPYTAPFVISAWSVLFAANLLGLASSAPPVGESLGELAAIARSIGQVMFQDHWISGCVFLAGTAVGSRPAAAWAIIGSGLGFVFARGLGFPADLAFAGIFGFNAALSAVALAAQHPRNALSPLAGIVLSVLLTRLFQNAGVPPLTAPFVLSTWVVLAAARAIPTRAGRA